jgi:hypothetical protein
VHGAADGTLRPFAVGDAPLIVTGGTGSLTSNRRHPDRDAGKGVDDHGFSGMRLRTARERDASRALPQCVATVPPKASRGTTSYYMPVQPEEKSTPFADCAPAHHVQMRA